MLALLFILGLIVGSFLNVVIYRLNIAESIIFGGSKCPKCKTKIKWYDNIPVISFVLLNFKCRNCREKISWQYPLVEILTGTLFALAGLIFFPVFDYLAIPFLIFILFSLSLLIVITVYDWLYMEIPGIAIWMGVILVIIFNVYSDWQSHLFLGTSVLEARTYSGIIAAAISFVFFFSLSYFSKEKWMGMGDAYLVVFLGLLLGLPQIFYALIMGFSLGSVIGIALVIFGEKKLKSRLPLAPFLVAGTIITLFFYQSIANWYWGLFYI